MSNEPDDVFDKCPMTLGLGALVNAEIILWYCDIRTDNGLQTRNPAISIGTCIDFIRLGHIK